MRLVQGEVRRKSPGRSCGALFLAVLTFLQSDAAVQAQQAGESVDAVGGQVNDLKAALERAESRISELEGLLFKPDLSRAQDVDLISRSPVSRSTTQKQLAEVTPKIEPLSPAQEGQLTKADELLQRGDVAGARLLLEYLLSTGSAAVAFKLAETYDPKRLADLKVFGLRGDPQKAQELYQKAQAGSPKAPQEPARWPMLNPTGAATPTDQVR
jgi:hypothetical protein